MIIVYTGNGKGKTSACVGQAVRAYGQGKVVAFGQFFKLPGQAGEQNLLKAILNDNFRAAGPGFYFPEHGGFAEQRRQALELLAWAREKCGRCFLLILDEAIYALQAEIITEQELSGLIDRCREQNTHLVLSGRGLPDWLRQEADLISDIQEVKHPLAAGQKALPGIEF